MKNTSRTLLLLLVILILHAKPPKSKKNIDFPCPQNKLFQGDKGGQNGENPCVYGGLMVFLHT
jgi:hypothetical protein